MTGREQKPVFELQLYLPSEIKRSGSRHIETLSLPAADERFEQVREALGADRLEQCRIINIIGAKRDLVYCLPLSYDLKGLNAFAKAIARKDILSSEAGSNKLMAALEAELPEDMEAALEIAENQERYDLLRDGLKSPKDYAFYVMGKDEIRADKELDAFVDYEAFGKYRMKEDGAIQTSHGLILRKDRPIEELPAELTEIRLFSPLKAEFYYRNEWGDYSEGREEMSPSELCEYEEQIKEKIEQEQLDSEGSRGLAVYLDHCFLERKVASMMPTVEVWRGELWGVLEVKSYGSLSEKELEAVKDYWSGQESDGWGEGFEQRSIQIPEGELYVSFWNPSDSFFITTEEKLKGISVQEMSMGMIGI